MNVLQQLSPSCVQARYEPCRLPHFRGNPLIEALPRALEPEEALDEFSVSPEYSAEQREWTVSERLQMLKTLSNFMVPLERHVAYAAELDSLLRNGYVGRAPGTPEYTKIQQQIYETRLNRSAPIKNKEKDSDALQLSLLLMGVSGMGKTRFTKRWARTLPRVIYHPDLHVYQIPVLHIELPSNGESVTGLCISILSALDKLIPGSTYLEQYGLKGRPSADKMIPRVALLLHMHCVGMLICDEVQNLTNAGKSKETVMTELVSMSNVCHLPLVFIGTNKAENLFGLDFRKTRRVCGFGGEHWDRLHEGVSTDDGRFISEWRDFLEVLWQYQWTKKPAELTEELASTLYWCCQGVVDTAIKMFASTQARAILDGTEVISTALLLDVYKSDFKLMHPMLDALRSGDDGSLARYADIRPLAMDGIIDSLRRRSRSLTSPAYTVKPSSPRFGDKVATALIASGFHPQEAVQVAQEVVGEGTAKNLLEATVQGVSKLKPSKTPRGSGNGKGKVAAPVEPDYSARPQDYRHLMQRARREGVALLEVLKSAGAAPPLEKLLDIA